MEQAASYSSGTLGKASSSELGRLRSLVREVTADGERRRERAVVTGWESLDGLFARESGRPGLACGVIHEWFGLELPSGPGREWRPPLFLLAHLAERALSDRDDGSTDRSGAALWIGRSVWPYPRTLVRAARAREVTQEGPRARNALHTFELELALGGSGLASTGGDESLLSRSVFVDPKDDGARLWAIDAALRSRAAAVVVADGSRLPMAASRRLQLAAREGGALVLLARPPSEASELSCATTRFHVRRSETPSRACPSLGWTVELLRSKGASRFSAVTGLEGVEELAG